MAKKVIFVNPNDPVPEVAQIMATNKLHGVPVLEKDKIVGIITETDFFIRDYPDLYLPSYIDFLKKTKFHKGLPRKKKKETNKLLEAKARDIMSEKVVTIVETQDVSELVDIYQSSSLYSIPVVNQQNKMVGIVTQGDIIKLVNFQ